MEKPFPCQEKVPFFVQKGERILKNPLRKTRKTIFPMNLHRDSKAHFTPPETESARDLNDRERSELIAGLTAGGFLCVVNWSWVEIEGGSQMQDSERV
jgi:hypothetical protein